MLQWNGMKLGVIIDRTPKCHPEMAGEGIEYTWGCSKLFYRRLPILEKKKKEKFISSVRKSLNTENVLTIDRVRRFARKARTYIVNYNILDNKLKVKSSQKTFDLIEGMRKQHKTHRSVFDFVYKYINNSLKEEKTASI